MQWVWGCRSVWTCRKGDIKNCHFDTGSTITFRGKHLKSYAKS